MAFSSKDPIFTAFKTALFLCVFPVVAFAKAETSTRSSPPETGVGEGDASTVTYPADFFSRYDPVTALDMLNRIPGIDSVVNAEAQSRRGLGAGSSAILIDGRRIAGKENSGSEMLSRIAAKQVDYVEIIRGSSAELEVRTAGPIVNIVMHEGASRSSVSAELKTIRYGDGELGPGGSFSFGGQTGNLNYLASLTAEPYYERQVRRETSVHRDGRPKDSMDQTRIREQTDYELAGNFGYQFSDRDLLQFNAFVRDNSNPHEIHRTNTRWDVDPLQINRQFEERESERTKWEVGGNYQHGFADGRRMSLIFVVNESVDDWYYDRFELQAADSSKVLYIGEDKMDRERILRFSFNTPLTIGQDLELGLEAAQTTLDKSFRMGLPRDGAADPRFGGLAPISDVDSFVEEIRYEPFLIHNWRLGSDATLESTLVAEISEISQRGTNNGRPVEKAREFEFLKPKFDYRYDINQRTQLRATLERDISQLSFANFSTGSSDTLDLDKNVSAGNADLVQEKTWRYEVNLEYRLPGEVGVLNSRVFYDDIDDVIDRVAVSTESALLLSAPGNIGDGKRYGAELDASVRLHALDMPDALLTIGALVEDSEVTDPFLEESRRITSHGRGQFKLGFRHDLPLWNLNYGADYTYPLTGAERIVEIGDIEERFRPPDASLFVEKIAFGGITFRLESTNLLDEPSCYERNRYAGGTATRVVEEVESYCYTYGPKVALKIKTTF
ncbi:TonB-dependent receptor plug domain-containing protein [Gilvimarinus sp. F26214L]|uniref:TonB-dependent receptor plug domain-containing protein n=1 Tax=Gilvimarinus sp. DZF01 TaxID=3461371 RepID=UPI0040451E3C